MSTSRAAARKPFAIRTHSLVGAALLGSISIFVGPAARADGQLDGTFGISGKVVTNISKFRDDNAGAIAIQPDGKIVAVGSSNVEGTYDFALARYNTDGTLDPTFGAGGLVTTDFGNSTDYAYAVVIQPDLKIVVAGDSSSPGYYAFALARYNPDGTLDGGFGSSGRLTTHFGATSSDTAVGLAIQTDGKLIAAGYSNASGTNDFALARYNVDGSLDATYGTGGLVTTNFGASSNDQAGGIVIQADGRAVLAGSTNLTGNYDFALARYNTNGALDSTFGTGGLVLTDFGVDDFAACVTLQKTDGKILAGGTTHPAAGYNFALARYNTNGTLDSTFGTGGRVSFDLGAASSDEFLSLAVQSDGRIVAAGTSAPPGSADVTVVRFLAGGALDGSFGSGGMVTTSLGGADAAHAVAIQSDAKIVVAGSTNALGNLDFALVRYFPSGALDTSLFGGGTGIVTTNFPGMPRPDYANAMAIQSDGKIVAAGTTNVGSHYEFAVARYDANGTLDGTFGIGGMVTAAYNDNVNDLAYAVGIQYWDGKIVVAGTSTVAYGKYNFVVRRFNPDGSRDTTFGSGGAVWTSFFGTTSVDEAFALAIQSDGKIILAGQTTNGSNTDFALARYNADGSLDATFGSGGKVTTNFGGPTSVDVANALILQQNGKIVAGGRTNFGLSRSAYGLVRYNTNGTLDTTFGAGGLVETDFGGNATINALALQQDGKIVAAGNGQDIHVSAALARYNTDGTLDTVFGTGGKLTTHFGAASTDYGTGVVLQSDGKICTTGATNLNGSFDFYVARYTSTTGTLDTSFGVNGVRTTDFATGSNDQATALAMQGDGALVVAGFTEGDFALARYTVCVAQTAVAANDGPICLGKTLQLLAAPGAPGGTYSWTGPNGFTSTEQNPTIPSTTMANAGTYHVTITPPGCSAWPEATTTVTFFSDGTGPTVTAPAGVALTQTICQ